MASNKMSLDKLAILNQLHELNALAEAGHLSMGQISLKGRNPTILFTVTGGNLPSGPRAEDRLIKAAAWMQKTGRLGRVEFFAGFSLARNSARLHHAAIRELAKRGMIVKEGKYWIWKHRR